MIIGGHRESGVDVQLREWREDDITWWLPLRRPLQPRLGDDFSVALAAGRIAEILHRTVAEVDGEPVGASSVAAPLGTSAPGVVVAVREDRRGLGVGGRLWGALCEADFPALRTVVDDTDTRTCDVLRHWGFRDESRSVVSSAPCDAAAPVGPLPPGHVVLVVPDADLLAGGPGLPTPAELDELLLATMTHPEAATGLVMDGNDFRKMFDRLLWVLVQDPDGRLVAVTSAQQGDAPDWQLVYTGVRPGHRRLGLARGVKQRLHVEAARRGAQRLETENDSANEGMRALNDRLGYVRTEGTIRFVRRVEP